MILCMTPSVGHAINRIARGGSHATPRGDLLKRPYCAMSFKWELLAKCKPSSELFRHESDQVESSDGNISIHCPCKKSLPEGLSKRRVFLRTNIFLTIIAYEMDSSLCTRTRAPATRNGEIENNFGKIWPIPNGQRFIAPKFRQNSSTKRNGKDSARCTKCAMKYPVY